MRPVTTCPGHRCRPRASSPSPSRTLLESSSRIHCSFTGRSPVARATSAGVERHVVGAVVPVAARAFGVDAVDVRGIGREGLGDDRRAGETALAVRPHRELAAAPLRHRAPRGDRAVNLERSRIGRVSVLAGPAAGRGSFSFTTESTDFAFVIRCSNSASPTAAAIRFPPLRDFFSASRALIACSSRLRRHAQENHRRARPRSRRACSSRRPRRRTQARAG